MESIAEKLLRINFSSQIFNCLIIVGHALLFGVFRQELQLFRTEAKRHSFLWVIAIIKHVIMIELCKIIFILFFLPCLACAILFCLVQYCFSPIIRPQMRRFPKHSNRSFYLYFLIKIGPKSSKVGTRKSDHRMAARLYQR
jgi:hypothetical protein